LLGSPFGGGTLCTIVSSISIIPYRVLALVRIISSSSHPIKSIICLLTTSIIALGKSILFITGIISSPASIAKYRLLIVCASTPCAASTTKIAPSQAARERETSYEKSTCPGVSIKFNV
jgi:hypothetical protein